MFLIQSLMSTNILLRPDNNIPIALLEKNDFLERLPYCFHRQFDGTITHDPAVVNVFADKRKNIFLNAYKKTVKVVTWEEFDLFRKRLLTLPIFVMVTLERKRKIVKLKKRLRFVFCLNPVNPVIKTQLELKLKECEWELKEGGKFCLQIDFGRLIYSWYRSNYGNLFKRYKAVKSDICLTNHKRRADIFYNPHAWVILLPVMMLVAPFYCFCRIIRCNDVRCQMDGFITFLSPTSTSSLS